MSGDPGRWTISDAGPTSARPPFRFSYRTTVSLDATDAVGVVYFGRWAGFVEQAVVEYRAMLGLDSDESGPMGGPGHRYLIRSFGVDYHAPGRLGDRIELFVRCADLGRTSHTFEVRAERDDPQRTHLADARLVVVGVDRYGQDAAASPIPEHVRRATLAFEAGETPR